MTQPSPQCPKCGAERADWMLCARCVDKMRAHLDQIPSLWADLQDTRYGQARMGDGGAGGKGKERPLLYREKASKASTYVHNQLSTYVRELDMGDAANLGDNVRAMSFWLRDRLERIRSQENADEIADEFDYCVKIMLPIVDRPADLEFYGKCGVCEADLYAPHGSVEGYCRKCKAEGVTTTYDPAANRAEIQGQVEHRWGTANECARILGLFGLEVSVKTIKHWTWKDKHGVVKLEKRGENHLGHPVYRFGDVMDLSRERVEKRKRGQAA